MFTKLRLHKFTSGWDPQQRKPHSSLLLDFGLLGGIQRSGGVSLHLTHNLEVFFHSFTPQVFEQVGSCFGWGRGTHCNTLFLGPSLSPFLPSAAHCAAMCSGIVCCTFSH